MVSWPCLVLAALLAAPPSQAGADPLVLQWQAPDPCPSAAEVRDGVASYLTGAEHPPAEAAGEIVERGPGHWQLRLTITIESGVVERSLTGESCAVISDAAALMIAVAIDPTRAAATDRVTRRPPPAEALAWPEPHAPAPTSAALTPERARDAPAPAPPKRAATGHVHVEGVADFGALPAFAGGIAANAGATVGRGRVEATALYLAPQDVTAADEPDAGATFQLWTVGARGCFVSRVERTELPICLGARAGVLRARGFGLEIERAARPVWAAVDLGVGVQWFPIRWLGLGAAIAPWIAVSRPRFAIDDLGVLHRARRLGFSGRGGLVGRFP